LKKIIKSRLQFI